MRDLIERFGSAATTSRVVADRPQIRPDLLKYVVSIKRSTSSWVVNDELRRARELYDAGTHEMVQSTSLGWSVLYLIPRQTPTAPRDYFRTMIHVEDLPE